MNQLHEHALCSITFHYTRAPFLCTHEGRFTADVPMPGSVSTQWNFNPGKTCTVYTHMYTPIELKGPDRFWHTFVTEPRTTILQICRWLAYVAYRAPTVSQFPSETDCDHEFPAGIYF